MVFKRQKYTSTAEILDLMSKDDEIMHSTSVLYFHRSDKVAGKIYLRKGVEPGLVYAAHVSNMPFNIGARIKPLIDEEEYEDILRQVGGNSTDPSIARLAVSKQLVGEKIVDGFIREYLFAAASEIFSWTEVIGRWENATETRDFASRHYIGLELLRKKAADRDAQYRKMIEDTRLDEESIDSLKLLRKGSIEDYADIENRNLQSIIHFANGQHTIEELRAETGLLKIPAFTGVYSLWNAGRLQLIAGDVPVYPPSLYNEDPVEEEEETVPESLPLVSEPESETVPAESKEEAIESFEEEPLPEPEELEADNDIEEFPEPDYHSKDETYDITSLPAPLPPSEADPEEFDEEVLFTEEAEPFDEPVEEEPVSNTSIPLQSENSIFNKLYAKIEALQKEVNSADEKISTSEARVSKIDAKIQQIENALAQAQEERNEALNHHNAIVAQSSEARTKLESIIASIDNLTAG